MDFLMRQHCRFGGIWRYEPVDRRRLIALRVPHLQDLLAWEMQSEVVSGVLKMGYRRDLVRDAVERHLWVHDCGFSSWVELVNAVLDLQEKEDRMRHPGPSQMEILGLGTPQVHERDIDPREQYKSEQRRLASFATWPAGAPMQPREPAKAGSFPHSFPVSVFKMAEAGFYYSGTGDRVVCFSCGGSVEGWEFGDTAMGKHKRLHPHCDFVNGRETRNKPLPPPRLFPAPVLQAAPGPPGPVLQAAPRPPGPVLQAAPGHPGPVLQAAPGHPGPVLQAAPGPPGPVLQAAPGPPGPVLQAAPGPPGPVLQAAPGHPGPVLQAAPGKEVDLNDNNNDNLRQPPAAPPPVPQAERDINPREQYKSKSEQRRLDYMERHLDNNSERDMNEHSQHFSSFPSTRDSNVGDIPIEDQDPSLPLSVQQSVPSTPPASQVSGLYQPGTPQVHDIDPREHYKSEQKRLESFATWPAGAPIQPRELAKAGFFYTGSDDRVQCFCCKGILRDWEAGDRAMNKHCRHFSSCQFVQNSNVRNVPIKDHDPKYGDTARGERERLHLHCDSVNGWETRNKPLPPPVQFPVPVTPAAVAPPTPAGRDYTEFLSPAQQNKLTRKEADPNLPRPPSTQQSVPSTLPASQSSGLYQPGLEKVVEDSMKCFYCEGELQNWEPEDEPWTEHAKWCKFLQQERGDDYVQGSGVQARFPNLHAQQQHVRPPDEAGTGNDHSDFQSHTHDQNWQKEDRMENESGTTTGDATYHEDLEYVGEKMCKMCMEAEIDIVFISCGHLTVSVCTYSFTLPPGLSTKCANGREGGFSS